MTDRELGAVKAIPMPAHLGVDFAAGAPLAASPWPFGFASVVWIPHVVLGVAEIGAALLTQTRPAYGMTGGAARIG